MRWREQATRCGRCNPRPTWWRLYVIAVFLVAVVGLVEAFVGGEGLRKVLETVATVAGFGLILAWLRGNRIALELEQRRRRT
jgi:hydrogenase/urease accessory protein HupE